MTRPNEASVPSCAPKDGAKSWRLARNRVMAATRLQSRASKKAIDIVACCMAPCMSHVCCMAACMSHICCMAAWIVDHRSCFESVTPPTPANYAKPHHCRCCDCRQSHISLWLSQGPRNQHRLHCNSYDIITYMLLG